MLTASNFLTKRDVLNIFLTAILTEELPELITFTASFKCKPTLIDDGTSVYQITFKENGDFSITDLDDPNPQNSSNEN